MNPEMEEDLQDLKDIRNHMYRYYDIGQEYIKSWNDMKRQRNGGHRKIKRKFC